VCVCVSYFFFVCFFYCGEFFIFLFLFSFFFLYYQLHHHYVLIPTLSPFTLPASPVLQSSPLHPNYSSAPSHPILSQPVTRLPLSPTHSPPSDQPPVPTLYNPNLLQSLTQAPYTTTTEIHPNTHKGHKTKQLPHYSLTHPLHLPLPLSVPP
jgi:hypothetical protein